MTKGNTMKTALNNYFYWWGRRRQWGDPDTGIEEGEHFWRVWYWNTLSMTPYHQ